MRFQEEEFQEEKKTQNNFNIALSLSLSIVSQQEEVFENKEENDVSSNSINNKDFDDDQSL